MNPKKGFTLIELLVVIAIIALLLAIITPALKMAKEAGRTVVCANGINQIGKALQTYASEYDTYVPRAETTNGDLIANGDYQMWPNLLAPYIGGDSTLLEDFWEIEAYNCASYPTKIPDAPQIFDYVVNVWGKQSGQEVHGPSKMSQIRNTGSIIYLSEYAYYQYSTNTATGRREQLPSMCNNVKVINPDILRTTPRNTLYLNYMRWMDCYAINQLPNSDPEANPENLNYNIISGSDASRRVALDRHKDNGTNNLFFDGHVEWLNWKDNHWLKWAIR